MTGLNRQVSFESMCTFPLFFALAVVLAATAFSDSDMEEHVDEPRPHNILTAVERAAGWRLLFDGQTTNGWRSYNGEAFPEVGWDVADGNLIVLASDGEEEGNGGDINAFTSFDHTVYYVEIASRFLDTAIDVLSDAMGHSLFDPVELKKELEVVVEEIRRGEDSPSRQYLPEFACPGLQYTSYR